MTDRQLDTALRTLSECQSLARGNLRLYNGLMKVRMILTRERRKNDKLKENGEELHNQN